MIRALVIAVACARQWLVRARRPVMALVVAAALTGCDGSSGSGQRGSAFTFLTVDNLSQGNASVATVNSPVGLGDGDDRLRHAPEQSQESHDHHA